MSKHVFVPDGQVPSATMNSLQNHVHTGVDADGSAPMVDLTAHVTGVLPGANMQAWKAPVANAAALPGSGNTAGDCRLVKDTDIIYAWTGAAWVVTGFDASAYVLKNGGTMQADPTVALGVATKQYVDAWLDTVIAAGKAYDSGWFAVAASQSYVKNHGLGVQPRTVRRYLSNTSNGATYETPVAFYNDVTDITHGMAVITIGATSLTVKTGGTLNLSTLSEYAGITSGYARVIAIK